ncbi:MAG TPA: hypothetical protein VGA16_05305 [Candidatus Limnocylindria bacterium]
MRLIALCLTAAIVACTPASTQAPSPPATAPVATTLPATQEPAPTSVATPLPVDPGAASPTPSPEPAHAFPKVTLKQTAFPMAAPSGTLTPVAWDRDLELRVRNSIEQEYLPRLDEFRKTGNAGNLWGMLPAFKDVVVQALRETARPGVVRKFQVDSLRVDAVYQKPWGSNAIVEVTATIRDKVVSGSAQDEIETGRLRLGGDNRFSVIDGWDGATGRWFSGFPPLARSNVEPGLTDVLSWYLASETWVPSTPTDALRYSGPAGVETTFAKARNAWLATFDRGKIVSRLIQDATAEIERFEPGTELGDGIATIRLDGTVVTTDASGTTQRTRFEGRVRAFVLSWGMPCCPVVIDEEASPGVWRSGGDISLKQIDRQFG